MALGTWRMFDNVVLLKKKKKVQICSSLSGKFTTVGAENQEKPFEKEGAHGGSWLVRRGEG